MITDLLSGMLAARYPRANYVTQALLTEQFNGITTS
jgi:hypothetical protein